jgi:hypothetical protein
MMQLQHRNDSHWQHRRRRERRQLVAGARVLFLATIVLACTERIPISVAFLAFPQKQSSTLFGIEKKSFSPKPFTRADRKASSSSSFKTTMYFDHQHQQYHTTYRKKNVQSNATTYSSTELSGTSFSSDIAIHHRHLRQSNRFKIYCDMDGVLVDFEKGVQQLLRKGTSNLDKEFMWKHIAQTPHWFERLEWKQDGKKLWHAIKHLRPDILTGVPNIKSSCVDKYNWCKRELNLLEAHHVDMAYADGPHCAHESINGNLPREDTTNVITCWSKNKYRECKEGS